MNGWNFADVWEIVADAHPDWPAVVQGGRRVSWRELDRRADAIAAWMLRQDVARGDRVCQYLYNGPEYLESLFAAMKAGLAPANTNYRYKEDELAYLFDEAGAAGVVFHSSLAEHVGAVRGRATQVRFWLCVEDGPPCPDWATPYAAVAGETAPSRVRPPWGRSGDDLYLLFTGGTTGLPKGVMWRQDDWFVALNGPGVRPYGDRPDEAAVTTAIHTPGPVTLPACPLMHGTGAGAAMGALSIAGTVVLLEGRTFDPLELLATIERTRVKSVYLVGDAQARTVVEALRERGSSFDLSSLRVIVSSGAILSAGSKRVLLEMLPHVTVIDALGSSEALGAASSISREPGSAATARFRPGPFTKVIDDGGREIVPGSGDVGRVLVGGRIPLGYWNDPDKTAATFVDVGGERYTITGDHATVASDGTIEFLGRGSVSINTGGEKVFPDEVEALLREHPAVADAVVVGVPDERFGQAVAAVVELRTEVDDEALRAYTRARLAGFKVPRHVVRVPSIERAPNGKADYRRLQALAAHLVGGVASPGR